MLFRSSIYRWILVSVSCLVVACQAVEVPSRVSWGGQIEFRVSGGFAGIRQSLIIRNDGTFIARDDRLKKEVTGRLDDETLGKLISSFGSNDVLEAESNKPPSSKRCADCIQYSSKAIVDNRLHHISINSADMTASPYNHTMILLLKILRESLSSSEPSHK